MATPFRRTYSRADAEQAAVYVSSSGVALAHAQTLDDDRCRLDLRADPIAELGAMREMLVEQVKCMGIPNRVSKHCNLVLAPEFYAMTLIDRPSVAESELRDAARWAIQEHVEFPVDQATVDVFELPRSASRDRTMLFVASMHTALLKSLLAEISQAGITVTSVDITDLAVRNLAWRCFPQPDLSVGLLRITSSSGIINVSRGDELYLSRRISSVPGTFAEDSWDDFRERLLLQVQRSIDYYESSMGQPPCNILLVSCTHGWSERVSEYLGEMLAMPVRTITEVLAAGIDLTLFNPEREDVDWEHIQASQANAIAAALPALGGALRGAIELAQEEAA
jgi:MSHA biogenesis protein MshI